MLSAWLADQRVESRERERRRVERRERLTDRRADFQRETLLSLQIASQKLLRNTGASLHRDIVAHRTTGKWQKQQLPHNLSDDDLRWKTEVLLLASRVRDQEVRDLVEQLRTQTTKVFLSRDEQEAEGHMTAAGDTQALLIQRIGQLVREMDDFE
jgi:hypothetical protein